MQDIKKKAEMQNLCVSPWTIWMMSPCWIRSIGSYQSNIVKIVSIDIVLSFIITIVSMIIINIIIIIMATWTARSSLFGLLMIHQLLTSLYV